MLLAKFKFPAAVLLLGVATVCVAFAARPRPEPPTPAPDTPRPAETKPMDATWTLRENGFQIEIGPNGFLDTKPTTLTLCRELGLGTQLIEASAQRQRPVISA